MRFPWIFNVRHKDWLTYSGGTHIPGELCYNFSISNYLTQMVNVPSGSLTATLAVLHFWIQFFLPHMVNFPIRKVLQF